MGGKDPPNTTPRDARLCISHMLGARCDNDFEKPVRGGRKREKEKN
jgi:hypothetical protein